MQTVIRCYCQSPPHFWDAYTGREAHPDNDVEAELACPSHHARFPYTEERERMWVRWAIIAGVNPEAYIGHLRRAYGIAPSDWHIAAWDELVTEGAR